ncbi:two-component sensor histidine kinase [Phytoactinopolyspora sp. XMNu-373]|uniref:histidine kinase n=2 Tax=Phytoactinopolyspora mesophila TaxID=2650750 RepID=A0A7K3MDQ8_9ACTN|nr:two-component sensor histidine kinase [Phytoactinopolyspora mesophila]
MLVPAVIAPPSAYPLAISAALVLAVAILAWPVGRVTLGLAAGSAAALSLAMDLGYFGEPGLALLWSPFELAALLVLLVRVIRWMPTPGVAPIGALTGAAAILFPLRFTLHDPGSGLSESVFLVALAVFPAVCAAGVGLYLRALESRRVRAVQQARRQQRLEVAADLHDFVAHEVTGIVLESQSAQLEELAPKEYRELLVRIEQAGQRALGSMDRTVAALRTAEEEGGVSPSTRQHGLADLSELVDRFAATSTAEVRLSLAADTLDAASRETQDTAYRVVLEALTNIRRHAAHAGRVEIVVHRVEDGAVEIIVVNDAGSGRAVTRRGGGAGLAGLAARVSALGGSLDAGPHDQSWRVVCRLPAGS